jgi:hypothetical protein
VWTLPQKELLESDNFLQPTGRLSFFFFLLSLLAGQNPLISLQPYSSQKANSEIFITFLMSNIIVIMACKEDKTAVQQQLENDILLLYLPDCNHLLFASSKLLAFSLVEIWLDLKLLMLLAKLRTNWKDWRE